MLESLFNKICIVSIVDLVVNVSWVRNKEGLECRAASCNC